MKCRRGKLPILLAIVGMAIFSALVWSWAWSESIGYLKRVQIRPMALPTLP
jgi:hypothetical protein